jgi:hypothetical protein
VLAVVAPMLVSRLVDPAASIVVRRDVDGTGAVVVS